MTSSNKKNVVNVRLDDDMLSEIDEVARAEDRPRANLLVRLLKEALDARKRAAQPKSASKK